MDPPVVLAEARQGAGFEPMAYSERGFARAFVQANTPTFVTYALGSVVLSMFCPLGAVIYAVYCVAGTVAIWATVCVHCPYYGRVCPAGYSTMSSSLLRKGREDLLARRYKLIWLYVAPSWLAPPLAASPVLLLQFSWPLFAILLAFLLMAFVVAPLLSRAAGCCDYWRGYPGPESAARRQVSD